MTHAEHVHRNYEAFKLVLPELLRVRRGWRALMKDGEVIDFYFTLEAGYRAGLDRYGLEGWSLQLVADEVILVTRMLGA